MNNNVPSELQGVYVPRVVLYQGIAIGGPEDGNFLSCETLTKFVPRKITSRTTNYNTVSWTKMTPAQIEEVRRADKEALQESMKARAHPHRYDYDMDEKIWRYVEYPITE